MDFFKQKMLLLYFLFYFNFFVQKQILFMSIKIKKISFNEKVFMKDFQPLTTHFFNAGCCWALCIDYSDLITVEGLIVISHVKALKNWLHPPLFQWVLTDKEFLYFKTKYMTPIYSMTHWKINRKSLYAEKLYFIDKRIIFLL